MTNKETEALCKLSAEELMIGPQDGRTVRGQIREILLQVKRHGGYSIFWVTSNNKRASIATAMIDAGLIGEDKKTEYPWCSMKINYEVSSDERKDRQGPDRRQLQRHNA